jgi:hypothetical protein
MDRPSAFQLAFSAFRPPIEPELITRGIVAIITEAALVTVIFGLSAGYYAEILTAMVTGDPPPSMSPARMQANLGSLISILAWPLWAAIEAANLRWFVRGERTGGPLALRFGADELRVMLVHAALFAIFMLVYLAAILPLIVGAVLAAAAPLVGAPVLIIMFLALFVVLAWVFARLAPTAALTIRDRSFGLSRAWSGMKGRSRRVIAAFLLLYAPYLAVMVLGGIIAGVAAAGGTDGARTMFGGWIETLRTPGPGFFLGGFVYGLATGAIAYILYLGGYAISALIAREIPPPEVAAPVSSPTSP